MPIDITSGKVSFGRKVQVAQFEPKEAAAEFFFNVPEGKTIDPAEADALFDRTKGHVYRVLGIAGAPDQAAAQVAAPAATEAAKKAGRPSKAAAATAAPASPATSAATVSEVDAIGGPTPGSTGAAQSASTGAVAASTQTAAAPPVTATDVMADFENPPPAEITDKLLLEHVTKKNQALKDPPKIHALVAEFAGPPPKTYAHVPQALRQKFLDRLQALA